MKLISRIIGVLVTVVLISVSSAKEMAPDFSLPSVDNKKAYSLSEFRGSIVVVNFWASWCADCIKEMPELVKFYNAYRERGVVVIGISIDRNEKKARDVIKEQNLSYLNLIDKNGDVFIDRFSIFGLPATIIISPEGTVEKRIIGPVSFESLKDTIDKLTDRRQR